MVSTFYYPFCKVDAISCTSIETKQPVHSCPEGMPHTVLKGCHTLINLIIKSFMYHDFFFGSLVKIVSHNKMTPGDRSIHGRYNEMLCPHKKVIWEIASTKFTG